MSVCHVLNIINASITCLQTVRCVREYSFLRRSACAILTLLLFNWRQNIISLTIHYACVHDLVAVDSHAMNIVCEKAQYLSIYVYTLPQIPRAHMICRYTINSRDGNIHDDVDTAKIGNFIAILSLLLVCSMSIVYWKSAEIAFRHSMGSLISINFSDPTYLCRHCSNTNNKIVYTSIIFTYI